MNIFKLIKNRLQGKNPSLSILEGMEIKPDIAIPEFIKNPGVPLEKYVDEEDLSEVDEKELPVILKHERKIETVEDIDLEDNKLVYYIINDAFDNSLYTLTPLTAKYQERDEDGEISTKLYKAMEAMDDAEFMEAVYRIVDMTLAMYGIEVSHEMQYETIKRNLERKNNRANLFSEGITNIFDRVLGRSSESSTSSICTDCKNKIVTFYHRALAGDLSNVNDDILAANVAKDISPELHGEADWKDVLVEIDKERDHIRNVYGEDKELYRTMAIEYGYCKEE